MACISCHADYTIYGPLKDKLQGLKRIYVQYVSTPPDPAAIRMPGGFENAQCLHCHWAPVVSKRIRCTPR